MNTNKSTNWNFKIEGVNLSDEEIREINSNQQRDNIKHLLTSTALGMMPATPWIGQAPPVTNMPPF